MTASLRQVMEKQLGLISEFSKDTNGTLRSTVYFINWNATSPRRSGPRGAH